MSFSGIHGMTNVGMSLGDPHSHNLRFKIIQNGCHFEIHNGGSTKPGGTITMLLMESLVLQT